MESELDLKSRIMETLDFHGDLTLSTFKSRIPEIKGSENYFLGISGIGNTNILLLSGVTNDFITTFTEMVNQKIVLMTPVNPAIVSWDGGEVYDLPIAKFVKKYKETRWLPFLVKRGENAPKLNGSYKIKKTSK